LLESNPMKICMVEDDLELGRSLQVLLQEEGNEVMWVRRATDARYWTAEREFNALLLDLGLPDGDGIDFIADVRKWSTVPVIVLSARTGEAAKITALDAGADDYLTKPFSVGELQARVRATIRRQRQPAIDNAGQVQFGDVTVDLKDRRVSKGGAGVHLTPTEFRLLAVMVASAGRVLTNPQLLRSVWGPSHAEDGHYLRIYMGHLRHKLEDDPAQPRYLLTETGVGYRLLTGAG
jgi:two-component system KDP operon response regulator KdpE